MKILSKQLWHVFLLLLLLFVTLWCIRNDDTILFGEFLQTSTTNWLFLSLLIPIIHQVYVLIAWRSQLYYNSLRNVIGENGFPLYKWIFLSLLISRPISIVFLSISNAGTLDLKRSVAMIVSIVLFMPGLYVFYSVKKYFGMDRALGIDHFEPMKYAKIPMVDKGIFQFASNGMYLFGFLLLYIPGLIALSKAAILVALFNHFYIWVHYYFTELPDMKEIYKKENLNE